MRAERQMRLTFIAAHCAIILCAVTPSLTLPTVKASENAGSQAAEPTDDWQGPLTVENPFVSTRGPLRPSDTRMEELPTGATSTAGPALGAIVDSDASVVYRLPNVAPQGTDPLAASLDDGLQMELPPDSLSGETSSAEPNPGERSLLTTPERSVRVRVDQILSTQRQPQDASNSAPRSDTDDPAVRIGMPQIVRHNDVPPTASDMLQPASLYLQLYTPTTNELTVQMLPSVQQAFQLAQRGALFAAETEFVQVLRRIAQANDAAAGDGRHARALAAGLRALDEAADFVPSGNQVEAELDVPIVASSHRTPVLRDYPHKVLPHEAVALYHLFAEQQLTIAVAGEQAGSMALYGLGRIGVLQAPREGNDAHGRQRSMTMFSAAIAARADNHLATNELGVLLCQAGRPAEAARVFERTIDMAPSALAYHNLAVVQRKLGMPGQANANEQESQRYASLERANGVVSRRMGVQWVSREELAGVAQPAPQVSVYHASPSPTATPTSPPTAMPTAGTSSWQQAVKIAKSLPLPGIGGGRPTQGSATAVSTSRPPAAPVQSSTRWR